MAKELPENLGVLGFVISVLLAVWEIVKFVWEKMETVRGRVELFADGKRKLLLIYVHNGSTRPVFLKRAVLVWKHENVEKRVQLEKPTIMPSTGRGDSKPALIRLHGPMDFTDPLAPGDGIGLYLLGQTPETIRILAGLRPRDLRVELYTSSGLDRRIKGRKLLKVLKEMVSDGTCQSDVLSNLQGEVKRRWLRLVARNEYGHDDTLDSFEKASKAEIRAVINLFSYRENPISLRDYRVVLYQNQNVIGEFQAWVGPDWPNLSKDDPIDMLSKTTLALHILSVIPVDDFPKLKQATSAEFVATTNEMEKYQYKLLDIDLSTTEKIKAAAMVE